MQNHLFSVILCGGSGTRLWPLSRTSLPKQFIKLAKQSLFEDTLDRVSSLSEQNIVVCGNQHRFLAADMILKKDLSFKKNSILLEPMPKNTALAIALAAFAALEKDKDAILLVLPSDHAMSPIEKFSKAIQSALSHAKESIVTFGIKANTPHTGYGYIENGLQISDEIFKVKNFTEKPHLEKAQQLLENNASWNSGIFLMGAQFYLDELEKYSQDIYLSSREIWKSNSKDLDFTRFSEELFQKAPSQSIDYAVMEKTDKALVYPLEINWSDLGSFESLHEKNKKDEQNNSVIGNVVLLNTKDSYIHASSSLVSVQHLENIAVIQTKDAVLVSPLDKTQELKELIAQIKENGHNELDSNSIAHRPWGHYESLITSDGFQVKHITVKPNGTLSSQMHHHRAEHWVVVKGTALVEICKEKKLVKENQSVYIPLGEVHRLSNPGQIDLELIEIQTGSYLGEDDIVRFEDIYGRKKMFT